ncbi:hypothetical protein HON22_02515 [Candidatus Peregrinibacteria bacterium]|jgi:hypothetical protein|nr:hypothetical protein [Candidatus Peregrinibacteria bacterium]
MLENQNECGEEFIKNHSPERFKQNMGDKLNTALEKILAHSENVMSDIDALNKTMVIGKQTIFDLIDKRGNIQKKPLQSLLCTNLYMADLSMPTSVSVKILMRELD